MRLVDLRQKAAGPPHHKRYIHGMPYSVLDWINFGRVAAERDDLLGQYFFDNGVLRAVIDSPSSFLVLGRKGAGKTAVFKYLAEHSAKIVGKHSVLVPLSFENYNWNVHSLLVNANKANSMLYKQSWRFVMLVESLRASRQWFEYHKQKVPAKIAASTKLLERVFSTPIPSLSAIVGEKLLSLSGLKLPKGGLGLDSGDVAFTISGGEITFDQVKRDESLRSNLSQNIESLISYFEDALSDFDESWPQIYLCFDRVDEAWDEESFSASSAVIAGLVSAADSISNQFSGKIRPIVFLREDIFSVLSINDKNKLREDCGELLHWDRDSLAKMILRRVNYFSSKAGLGSVLSVDELFDKTAMRQQTKPYNYLLKRTMMRPRDLISLLNRIVKAMRDKAIGTSSDAAVVYEKLECESVYDAEPGYSEWLKQELIDEWKAQKPVIADLFAAIQNHGSTIITRVELERNLNALGKNFQHQEILEHLRFLFDNSIIGLKIGLSNEWKFKCFSPSQGFVESKEYKVHEGLVRALNLTEPRGRDAA